MALNVVVKPTHLCNLDCTYCYNDDVRRPVMSRETLERTIEASFRYSVTRLDGAPVSFIWHGGEPTIAGIDFYRDVVRVQDELSNEVPFENLLQTNGTLLDDEWGAFLASHGFLASVSLDGPPAVNDVSRVDKHGKGSSDAAWRGVEVLRQHSVPFGVCVVLSRATAPYAAEIYSYLSENDLAFNVIPLNRSGRARDHFDDLGLGPDEYAPAWIAMYDLWFDATPSYVYCQDFVVKTRAVLAGRPTDCISALQCTESNVSVDPVGDVYACASLSGHAETILGNLVHTDLIEIMDAPVAMTWRHRAVDPQCAACRWQDVCNGGCQARAWKFFGTNAVRDYYCPSLFAIYEHIAQRVVDRIGGSFAPAPPALVAARELVDPPSSPVVLRRANGSVVA